MEEFQILKVDRKPQVHSLSKGIPISGSEKKLLLIAPESHLEVPCFFLSVVGTGSFVLKLFLISPPASMTILLLQLGTQCQFPYRYKYTFLYKYAFTHTTIGCFSKVP